MEKLRSEYMDAIRKEFYSYAFEEQKFWYWVVSFAGGIATEACYTDAEKGRRLKVFFEALREVCN